MDKAPSVSLRSTAPPQRLPSNARAGEREQGLGPVQKATPAAKRFAKDLRKELTPAETKLWNQLRAKRLGGYRFRRQHPIGKFIADFACVKSKVVIEVDGDSHFTEAAQARDEIRSDFIKSKGWTIFRCTNLDIYNNMSGTPDSLLAALTRSPTFGGAVERSETEGVLPNFEKETL